MPSLSSSLSSSLFSSLSSSLKNLFSAPAVTSTPAHVARKKTWKLFSCLALGATPAALASTLFSSPVLAQTVNATVPVTLRVPNVLQLQTWGNINLTLTPAQMLGGTPNASGELLLQAGTTTGSDPLTATAPAGASAVNVPISPLYYVWTTSSKGANVNVDVTDGKGTLTNTATSDTMTMTVTAGATANTGGKATGMGNNPLTGTATLTFNLTNAKTAGTYTGGSITITATNP
ncbi:MULTISPECIES: hypothetical protein [unclassified Microcoleus]|uniref:hypothetical protein n=1 Tax=unclassified Microcoleus TaxID=2642155 RepID=UPI002FD5F8EA